MARGDYLRVDPDAELKQLRADFDDCNETRAHLKTEIERLRAELDCERTSQISAVNALLREEQENERLRAALQTSKHYSGQRLIDFINDTLESGK